MTPREHEEAVAAHFSRQGYSVELTTRTNDFGVDVFATKGRTKLALQVKMYGGSRRKVNRGMVMELHGAKDYFDCTKAVIVTDGDVAPTARDVAAKLRIKILPFPAARSPLSKPIPNAATTTTKISTGTPTFDEVWKRYVMPLSGRTLAGPRKKKNTILRVDWTGVKRLTSTGRGQVIPVEVFQQAVGRLIERGVVTRDEINEDYPKRASSGVVLILSQVPFFVHLSNPSRLVLQKDPQV